MRYDFLTISVNSIALISSNMKRIQPPLRRIEIFEYLNKCVTSNSMIYFQETHSLKNFAKEWEDEMQGTLFLLTQEKQTLASCGSVFLG